MDPKEHFEVINFIIGHFMNFLEEIYQEKSLDVSSPLKTCADLLCMKYTVQSFQLDIYLSPSVIQIIQH